ncbi:MerR family transcriptional regulator [Fictibacillus sp. NRS-1165]
MYIEVTGKELAPKKGMIMKRQWKVGELAKLTGLTIRKLGLSLEEIKSVLDDTDYNPLEVLSLQIDRLKENIRIQQKIKKELENVSNLMQMEETVTVEDVTKLLTMMKVSHEKYFTERQMNMMRLLDRLGHFLAGKTDEPNQGRKE